MKDNEIVGATSRVMVAMIYVLITSAAILWLIN